MKTEEYNRKLLLIKAEHEKAIRDLNAEYALSNNPYKIGDLVTDHIGTVRIEKIQVSGPLFGSTPACVYFGLELKKDGSPRKDGSKRKVWQSNIR